MTHTYKGEESMRRAIASDSQLSEGVAVLKFVIAVGVEEGLSGKSTNRSDLTR